MYSAFLPRGVEADDTKRVFDAMLVYAFGALGLGTSIFYSSFFFFVYHSVAGALVLFTGGSSLTIAAALHWRWPSAERSGAIQCTVVLVITTAMAIMRGGFVPVVLLFLIPIPLLAVYLMGRGAAIAFTVATVLVDVLLFVGTRGGHLESLQIIQVSPQTQESLSLAGVTGATVVVALIAMTHAAARTAADSKREQAERRAMEEQRLKSLGQLAGSVAHDFNNLLMAIVGTAEFVLGELDEDSPFREDMDIICEASMRAKDLTHKLLLFSRKDVATKETMDVNRVIEASLPLVRRSLREDIELELNLAESLPQVTLNARQLEHALLNLTINARDAMPGGGQLSIVTTYDAQGSAEFREQHRAQGCVRISVRDTGIGMDSKLIPRIFEPFFTTKGAGGGTGLGLATIYGIITAAGGTIVVDSTPGEGTTFQLLLPEAVQSSTPPEKAGLSESSDEKPEGLVLLVEDDESTRRIVRRMLERGGFRVVEADDGTAALALFVENEDEVRLLLSDVVLPGMSGPALAAAARRRQPDLAVLLISGYPNGEGLASDPNTPRDALLLKPFTEQQLLRHVKTALAPRPD